MKVYGLSNSLQFLPDTESRDRILKEFEPLQLCRVRLEVDGQVQQNGSVSFVDGAKWTIKTGRSLPELRLYWKVMQFCSLHTPEAIEKTYGMMPPEAWHEIIKKRFGMTSIAFDKLDQDKFHDYNAKVIDYVCTIWECCVEDILNA